MIFDSHLRTSLLPSSALSLTRGAVRALTRTATGRRAAACVLGLAAALAVGAAAAAAGLARSAQDTAPVRERAPAQDPVQEATESAPGPVSPHASSLQTPDGARRPVRRPSVPDRHTPSSRRPVKPRMRAGVASVPPRVRSWPVDQEPQVLRGWEPPSTPYGPGHRGVDVGAAVGTPVRAVAAGTVSFAGRVAGRGVVSVELDGTGGPPLRTTYEPVQATVRKGDRVLAGEQVGLVERGRHRCSAPCLHWGLRRGKEYLDPLSLMPAWLLPTGPSRLLPVFGVAEPADRAWAERQKGWGRGVSPPERSW